MRLIEGIGLSGRSANAFKNAEKLLVQGCLGQRFQGGGTVFAATTGGGDMSAQLVGEKLHTIANTQDGQAARENGRIA